MRQLSAVGAAIFVLAASPALAQPADLTAQTRQFLDAYARGDKAAVLSQLDPSIVMYGSDAAELFRGPDAVAGLLDLDQKLWGGSATIGEIKDLTVTEGSDLRVATFHAPFSVGGRPPLPVRFTMVWKRSPDGWRLVHSTNTVPTTGQSAEALLKGG